MGLFVQKDNTADLVARLDELKRLAVYVGYQGASGAEIHPDSEITVAKLAAVHEWGDEDAGIPQRSYIRRTMLDHRRQIADVFKKECALVVEGKRKPVDAYAAVGKLTCKLVRKKLEGASSWAEPLELETVDAKGHARVLSQTETLARNLSWAVRRGRQVLASGS